MYFYLELLLFHYIICIMLTALDILIVIELYNLLQ